MDGFGWGWRCVWDRPALVVVIDDEDDDCIELDDLGRKVGLGIVGTDKEEGCEIFRLFPKSSDIESAKK